jgi:hypothetical protein
MSVVALLLHYMIGAKLFLIAIENSRIRFKLLYLNNDRHEIGMESLSMILENLNNCKNGYHFLISD